MAKITYLIASLMVQRHNFYLNLIILTNTHIALLATYINCLAVIVILDSSYKRADF